jgi:hypothetical protein
MEVSLPYRTQAEMEAETEMEMEMGTETVLETHKQQLLQYRTFTIYNLLFITTYQTFLQRQYDAGWRSSPHIQDSDPCSRWDYPWIILLFIRLSLFQMEKETVEKEASSSRASYGRCCP